MPIHKRKLEQFIESVLGESSEEAGRILNELQAKKEEAVAQAKEQIAYEAARHQAAKISEIKARESRRVSAHMTKNRLELFEYREDCAKEVFEAARRHIIEYVASPEYPEHLAGLLDKAIGQLGRGFSADVELRADDMHLQEYLLKSVTGVSLRFLEGDFSMGGLRLACQSRGLRVDLSFDSAMADQIGHFSELSGMYID